jgi:cellulose synthase (UDP-forming)
MLAEKRRPGADEGDGLVAPVGLTSAPAKADTAAEATSRHEYEHAASSGLRHSSERVVTGKALAVWLLIAGSWAYVTVTFWKWWLPQATGGTPWLFWPQTFSLLYLTTALPTFFFFYVWKMRRPIELLPPTGMRVALITLCVPGHESLEVIREQLEALASVSYPHDSWVLDEGASPDVRALAEELGIRYFTRKGIARWNEPHPPFQAATKAGNVNAWLDQVGELGLDYDVFVQFDIDHRPRPDYLDRVLGYFLDSEVAWVQAPSVCGNLDNWAARGLAEQDMIFQGPLQMGFYGASQTPFIIGSHTSYRTAAIREIGGFQPTRAEDHLDTVVLAAFGYTGVFVPELIAVGAGPDDFATYLRQQFAWAHSMIQIFLRHTPRLLRRYTVRQAAQFLMCQSWYTLWSLSLGILWASPTVALVMDRPIAGVTIAHFFVYFLPVPLMSTLMWCWARRWFQPAGLRLSWRGMLLEIARWPVVLWALLNVLLGIRREYMITPKGVGRPQGPRLLSIYSPYIVLTVVPLAALWAYALGTGSGPLRGYYGLALLNGVFGALLLVTTLLMEFRAVAASGAAGLAVLRAQVAILAVVASVICVLGLTAMVAWHPFVESLR